MAAVFPRSAALPNQSPLFWVSHKDRYLRQLLISDIEEETGRSLIVYFTDCDNSAAQIDQADDAYLSELLTPCIGKSVIAYVHYLFRQIVVVAFFKRS